MKRKFAAVQIDLVQDARERNLRRALRAAAEAAERGADFICLPEAVTCDYSPRAERFAEPVPGPATRRFMRFARERDVCVVVGVIEKAGDHVYNSAVLVEPEGIAGVYRKAHLWRDTLGLEGLDDPQMFEAGDTLGMFGFRGIRAGVMICWDGQYAEMARSLALAGADVIFYPNNRATVDQRHWARFAADNSTPVIAVNRCGLRRIYPPDPARTARHMNLVKKGGAFYYPCPGDSFIADESGVIRTHVSGQEGVIIAELDITRIRRSKKRNQLLIHRRPGLYALT